MRTMLLAKKTETDSPARDLRGCSQVTSFALVRGAGEIKCQGVDTKMQFKWNKILVAKIFQLNVPGGCTGS